MTKQLHEIIIVGGGLAGLSAALQLCNLGLRPLVIEGGKYPCHKVCGEFLSPECLPWFERLKINYTPIHTAKFFIDSRSYRLNFPQKAGALSHFTLDDLLAKKALELGTSILTETKVEKIFPKIKNGERHLLQLSNGQTLQASHLIIAAGRLPFLNAPPSTPKYLGIKAHFSEIPLKNTLNMFGFKGAYLGLCPIEEGLVNLACLANLKKVALSGSVDQFMEDLTAENPLLKELLNQGKARFPWMTASISFFGFKKPPQWKEAYFIGDAALSIPPASGGGLSLSILGGLLAAHYIVSGKEHFQKDFVHLCTSPMKLARLLDCFFSRPFLSHMAIKSVSLFPKLAELIFANSRISNKIY